MAMTLEKNWMVRLGSSRQWHQMVGRRGVIVDPAGWVIGSIEKKHSIKWEEDTNRLHIGRHRPWFEDRESACRTDGRRTAPACQVAQEISCSVGATPKGSGRKRPLRMEACKEGVIVATTSSAAVGVTQGEIALMGGLFPGVGALGFSLRRSQRNTEFRAKIKFSLVRLYPSRASYLPCRGGS
jgi:hypothetical protein